MRAIVSSDMVVSGGPKKNGSEHAHQIGSMALELIRQVAKQCFVPSSKTENVRIRVGLHSGRGGDRRRRRTSSTIVVVLGGPVCAGVVGSKMPR